LMIRILLLINKIPLKLVFSIAMFIYYYIGSMTSLVVGAWLAPVFQQVAEV